MMPFKSEKQRRFMYAKHPEIAKRWKDEADKQHAAAAEQHAAAERHVAKWKKGK
jgi:hypothetical protein